jgi:hypothetical protein
MNLFYKRTLPDRIFSGGGEEKRGGGREDGGGERGANLSREDAMWKIRLLSGPVDVLLLPVSAVPVFLNF